MKAVKVQYTVRPEYVEQNKANIRRVMQELKANPIEGMQYASFVLDDGQTFVHINMAKDEQAMGGLTNLGVFNDFRAALKASKPLSPPKSEALNLVEAGFEF